MAPGAEVFVEQQAELLDALEGAGGYADWIAARVRPFLGPRVLELGAGTGTLTRRLVPRERVVAVEFERRFAGRLEELALRRPALRVVCGDATDPALLAGLADERLDTLVSSNVLEHFDDDVGSLRAVRRALPSIRRAVVVVPAFEQLRGGLDDRVGHRRRYSPATLRATLAAGGFPPRSVRFMNLPGLFGWLVNVRLLDRGGLPSRQVALFDRLAPWLSRGERLFGAPPIGLSLVGVGDADA